MDSEPLIQLGSENNSKDTFTEMFLDLAKNINLKMCLFIFLLFIVINSDIFIENILANINGAALGNCATTNGTLIQGLAMTLGYLILNLLTHGNLI